MAESPDLNGPVLSPPDGIESNLDNPPNRNALVIGFTSFFLAISLIFLLVRAYARLFYAKNTQALGDSLIIPAIGTYIAACIIVFRIAITSGFFVHGWDFRLKDLAWFYYNLFLGTQLYLATMITLKSTILLEWARIFGPGSRKAFRWSCYIIAALNAIYYTINIILECTACTPREYYWDKTIPGGTCRYSAILSLISAIVNLVFDVAILILPQGVIWRLNMSRRKKVGCSVVFIIGHLACVCAALRIAFSVAYVSSDDYTYQLSPQTILCNAEVAAGFLVFTTPATPKPILYLTQQAMGSMDRLIRSARSGSRGTAAGVESGFNSQSRPFKSLFFRKKSGSNLYNPIDERNDLQLSSWKYPVSGNTTHRSDRL
ncbi:uncharacterized protein F4812DRAFT_427450 [Daldinia caldariorum]|uniref:uncharacterized protein n=1 Tax=Daldinia caldariorum TaxID=326644 RepID=UPI002007210B|nr:uncharacterized protein F4812DRAFT_427450 [Daldinia caldariorum]KAI1467742.1 hypothetical protein F4812DRAFT_427450 [Daldinia caldariorum]